jgi:pyridoxal phosphate enzyme (YggS family)
MTDIAGNIRAVRDLIAKACQRRGRSPDQVRLIAVTKEQEPGVMNELAKAGVLDFGENRLDHLETMRLYAKPGAQFHAIGRIQSRQVPMLASFADCIHSLCEVHHIQQLNGECKKRNRRLPVFLQINVSGEASKAGVAPAELPKLLEAIRAAPALTAVGLMTMAPALATGVGADVIRKCFSDLRELAHRCHLPRLSMGMSDDFEIAVEEGATDLRIGRRLFA